MRPIRTRSDTRSFRHREDQGSRLPTVDQARPWRTTCIHRLPRAPPRSCLGSLPAAGQAIARPCLRAPEGSGGQRRLRPNHSLQGPEPLNSAAALASPLAWESVSPGPTPWPSWWDQRSPTSHSRLRAESPSAEPRPRRRGRPLRPEQSGVCQVVHPPLVLRSLGLLNSWTLRSDAVIRESGPTKQNGVDVETGSGGEEYPSGQRQERTARGGGGDGSDQQEAVLFGQTAPDAHPATALIVGDRCTRPSRIASARHSSQRPMDSRRPRRRWR